MPYEDDFESSISYWSLKFNVNDYEETYAAERLNLKRIPQQIRYFFFISISSVIALVILDMLGAYAFVGTYHYELYDILTFIMYVPVILVEYLCWICPKLYILRGSIFTVVIYAFLFFSTLSVYDNRLDYPAVSPTYFYHTFSYSFHRILLWHGAVLFLYLFYVQSWIVSLWTYSFVYVEIIVITFYCYGTKFRSFGTAGCIVDSLYYILLFAAYLGFTVFAVRTFEYRERASFFAETKTRYEMESWKALLNDLPEPVILAQSGAITFCNNATHRFLDPQGARFRDIQIMQYLEKIVQDNAGKKPLSEMISSQILIPDDTIKGRYIYDDGSHVKVLQVKCVEIKQRNGMNVMQYIVHDITALEDLDKEKVQKHCFQLLVATASHDIRTPINIIQGVHENLELQLESSQAKELLKIAQIACQRMLLYVRALAYLEHLEGKTLQIDKTLFDVPSTFKELFQHFKPSIRPGVEVEEDIGHDVPFIVSDKEKYETILYHILENAAKYTMSGKICINIKYDYDTNMLSTQVKDTGIGIKDNQKEVLGKLFSKKYDTHEPNMQGIGLGLHLAKSLSEELGGQLLVASSVGVGTSVKFTIKNMLTNREPLEPVTAADVELMNEKSDHPVVPKVETFLGKSPYCTGSLLEDEKNCISSDLSERAPLNAEAKILSLSTIKSPSSACDCSKILIVDDDPMNLSVFKNYMASTKYKADVANNGQEALDAILNKRKACEICKGYKLVFMDINMPVMNGYDATERIFDYVKQGIIPNICVVAITAAAHLEDKQVSAEYRNAGFTDICIFI